MCGFCSSMCKYYYGYLHGFASGPNSFKGVHLKKFLKERLDIPLYLFNLNVSEDDPYFLVSDAISTLLRKDLEMREATNDANFMWRCIGSSLGAYTAARFAHLFPSRVDKLVLLSPAFNLVETWTNDSNDSLLRSWKEVGWRRCCYLLFKGKGSLCMYILFRQDIDSLLDPSRSHFRFLLSL